VRRRRRVIIFIVCGGLGAGVDDGGHDVRAGLGAT
jgi:hypothetical protein